MLLELPGVALELAVDLRHLLLQSGYRLGIPNPGDHVLALCVGEVVAVQLLRARDRVPGEGNSGAGCLAHVAEDHHLHVDRGPEVVGDALHAPVGLGAVGVPRPEDGVDRLAQLLDGVGGKRAPRLFLIDGEEPGHQRT